MNEDMTLRERIAHTLIRNLAWWGGFSLTMGLLIGVVFPFMAEHDMFPKRPVTFQNKPVEDRR